MEPFRQKGSSMASWSTFIFKSVLVVLVVAAIIIIIIIVVVISSSSISPNSVDPILIN